jgi:hypothetical protein
MFELIVIGISCLISISSAIAEGVESDNATKEKKKNLDKTTHEETGISIDNSERKAAKLYME